ncbi:MAG: hypothetical protein ACLFPQ_01695 [Candidatus Woesearchaeota archaeon]
MTLITTSSAIEFHEVFYDPPGDDNNREFIELLMEFPLDLENYTISDEHSNDTLETMSFVNSNLALIVEEGFNYSFLNCSVYSAGATIGNNLNNDADSLKLFDRNHVLVDSISYNRTVKNFSLNVYNKTSYYASPNPCEIFIPEKTIENTTQNEDTDEDDICDYSLDIITDKSFYHNETMKFRHEVYPSEDDIDYEITYRIEDLYGNIKKEPYTTKNTNEKSFTSKEYGTNVYKIISYLEVLSCNETNITDNEASLIFIHHSDEPFSCPECICEECENCPDCPEIICPDCEPCMIKEGQIMKTNFDIIELRFENNTNSIFLRFNASKGDTRKTAIYIYAKSGRNYITEKKTFYLKEKNSYNEFTLILPLKKDVDLDEPILFIEGLDISINETINLGNDFSKEYAIPEATEIIETKNLAKKNKISYQPERLTSRIIYESRDVIRKELISYFFLAASIILNIIYLFRRP